MASLSASSSGCHFINVCLVDFMRGGIDQFNQQESNNALYCSLHGSVEGKILVASPDIDDEIFRDSLVYIYKHNDLECIGFIVNKQIGEVMIDGVRQEEELKSSDSVLVTSTIFPLLYGGPLDDDCVVAISISPNTHKPELHLDISKFFTLILTGDEVISEFLILKGVSVWEPGQLDHEILSGDWLILDEPEKLLFSHSIEDKWENALKTIGVDKSLLVRACGNA